MISTGEVVRSIYGAWRLACRDPLGLQLLDTSEAGFWRSFYAALIALPPYAIMTAFRLARDVPASEPARLFAIESIAYVIGWTIFPLAAFYLTRMLGRAQHYTAYVVAYNWASVLQMALYLPVTMLSVGGVVSTGIGALLGLIAMGAIVSYQYYIARTVLDIEPMPAVGLVVTDLMLGLMLNGTVEYLEGPSTVLQPF
jgi:hypothetical protein